LILFELDNAKVIETIEVNANIMMAIWKKPADEVPACRTGRDESI